MKVVFISDTHNQLDRIAVPDGDLLIHCGDFSMGGLPNEVERFNRDLERLPHKHKIVIAGNHDFLFESQPLRARSLLTAATYLQDESTEIEGLKVYGSPWQPEFMNWAFNVPRKSPRMEKIWAAIPDDTDILVTHGPPYGILDLIPDGGRVGCELLRTRVDQVKPRIHCFGHIHLSYGSVQSGSTLFINASNLNERYHPVNDPIELELD